MLAYAENGRSASAARATQRLGASRRASIEIAHKLTGNESAVTQPRHAPKEPNAASDVSA
jgi:hypothetical protein